MVSLMINTLKISLVVILWLLNYISLNKQIWQLRTFSARKNLYDHWNYTIQRIFLSDFNGSNDKQPDFKTIGPFQCYADKDSPTGRFHSWDGRTTWCPHKGEREGRNHSISYLDYLVFHIIWACLDWKCILLALWIRSFMSIFSD